MERARITKSPSGTGIRSPGTVLQSGRDADAARESGGRRGDGDDARLDDGAEVTWRREAPSARNRAFSRVRWAMTMAKVLWMEKVATSRAMPENTSRRW